MRHRRVATPFLVCILMIFFMRLSAPAFAQATPPTDVRIGAYVVNIGGFEAGKGSFSADFYLWFSWKGNWSSVSAPDTAFPGGFELMIA